MSPGSSLRSGLRSSEWSIGFSKPTNSASRRRVLRLRRTKYPTANKVAATPTMEPTAAPATSPVPLEDEDTALVGEDENLGGRGREAVRGIEEVSLAEDSCA